MMVHVHPEAVPVRINLDQSRQIRLHNTKNMWGTFRYKRKNKKFTIVSNKHQGRNGIYVRPQANLITQLYGSVSRALTPSAKPNVRKVMVAAYDYQCL